MDLADRILKYRERHADERGQPMTQAAFARLIGLGSSQAVSLLEGGNRPGRDKVVPLARVLELTPYEARALMAWVLSCTVEDIGDLVDDDPVTAPDPTPAAA